MYKTCSQCATEKPHAEFSKHKSTKDGLFYCCKACNRERNKKYYEKNKEQVLERQKKYREENKEQILEQNRKYYEENKEKVLKRKKKYREDNREYFKKWREENREHAIEYAKKYHKENPHIARANNQKRRAMKKRAAVALTDNERLALQILNEECTLLGPGWHVDHIVPLSKGGLHHPDNLQIVRASYNLSKRDKVFNTRKYS
jgi:HNH endonuclease.